MHIEHGIALALEHTVRFHWSLDDRSHLHGTIDADYFEHEPYQAALLMLAPYVLRNPNVDKDSTVKKLMENLYCLDEADEPPQEQVSEFMETINTLSSYLKANYEPAR